MAKGNLSSPAPGLRADEWTSLRELTHARLALGRAGTSLPTAAHLTFQRDHALARDAVMTTFDSQAIARALTVHGIESVTVSSQAPDRSTYLQRPDLGRQLHLPDKEQLPPSNPDVVVVIGDGLSALAAHRHAVPMAAGLHQALTSRQLRMARVVIARGARVALSDDIGGLLGARLAIILLGERPGLSSPDSLGAYLTWNPKRGRTDAQRNCVSNIRPEGGLPYEAAVHKLVYLSLQACHLGLSGVQLKDNSASIALLK
ncbi:MAG: ethanolamine ammonia-lyase subunit EutC [Burkholderiaceae bacterium]